MDCPTKWQSTKVQKYKNTHISAIFSATEIRFCMEVHMDCPTKWQSIKVQKKYKSNHNSAIFWVQTPDFAWKFIWTVQPNDKVQKVEKYKTMNIKKYKTEKYKNSKNAKNDKNPKNVKSTKSTKKLSGASY